MYILSILGPYEDWKKVESEKSYFQGDPNYCDKIPFMFAFVILILKWLAMPIDLTFMLFSIIGHVFIMNWDRPVGKRGHRGTFLPNILRAICNEIVVVPCPPNI